MSDRGSYRSTYSVMLDTDEFRVLTSDARLVLHTIKNSRLNNMAGIFICRDDDGLITISKQSGLPVGRVSKAIQELIDTDWIAYREGILWVRNQLKFEPGITLANEKHKAGVINILKSLWNSEIVANYCKYYKLAYPFDRVSIPIRYKDTDTDTETDTEKERESSSSGKPDPPPFLKIITDLNKKAGLKRGFGIGEGNKRLIKALWNQGYRFYDFEYVHTVKCAKWKSNPKMMDFLRPKTLYAASNFEGYLNESHISNSGQPVSFEKMETCPKCKHNGPVVEDQKDFKLAEDQTGKKPIYKTGTYHFQCQSCGHKYDTL